MMSSLRRCPLPFLTQTTFWFYQFRFRSREKISHRLQFQLWSRTCSFFWHHSNYSNSSQMVDSFKNELRYQFCDCSYSWSRGNMDSFPWALLVTRQPSNIGHCIPEHLSEGILWISCLSSELYSFYCVHNSTTSTESSRLSREVLYFNNHIVKI